MDNLIEKSANTIRRLSAAMVEKAKSGHPGGAMGGADFVNILYSEFLNYDPKDGNWFLRDRFFLDPGHMSPMLYSILGLAGYFQLDDLKNFRQWESITPGHPEKDFVHGVENTSGPLGVGHTMAVGAAITERFLVERFGDWMAHKTYAFISDGGIQEEISQGAGRIAGHLGLSNLIMFYDSNDIQLSTETEEVTSEDTAKKYESWGWSVVTIDGNNQDEIRKALKNAIAETEKPTLIIGKTVMGKGAVDENGGSFERKCSTHGMPLSGAGASFDKTIENLGGKASDPFYISDDVLEFWTKVSEEKSKQAEVKKGVQADWEKQNADLSTKLAKFLSNEFSHLDFAAVEQKADNSTRGASAITLGYLAQNVENMIVASADLSNSDKTDGFLKHTTSFKKGDFSGSFLQAGVCELTMAAIANGMALHGGVVPVCATFFVFSDYMKPAVRLAALMEIPVKYVWTHDAFRVGEDGPTHQPVEHEAQIRLMEQLKNHSGANSLLALRPADADETTVAWKMALENTSTPTALLLSRQNIKSIDSADCRYQDALAAEKGGYIAYKSNGEADVILVGNGSEVATLIEGGKLVEKELGVKVQVASVISEGLFRNQDEAYQTSVLPSNKPTVGLTAGLPVNLRGLVGPNGKVFGLSSFGYSAPANVLDEKLGYTGANVLSLVKDVLKK